MENNFSRIQELLAQLKIYEHELNKIPYVGTIEIKGQYKEKYIYIRKRELDHVTSTYVGKYSEELYTTLLFNNKCARNIKRQIKNVTNELAELNYKFNNLEPKVVLNINYAKTNIKTIIYSQAVLEGIAATFADTEDILDNAKIKNVSYEDATKIINLKHAWQLILDKDVMEYPSNYYLSQSIAKLVNNGFFEDGGKIRDVPITIGGSTHVPPIPIENVVKENINQILDKKQPAIDSAIDLALFIMKTQVFHDGNKRTAIVLANHYLISHGEGFIRIKEEDVKEFKMNLIQYYEDKDLLAIRKFFKDKCWNKMDFINK